MDEKFVMMFVNLNVLSTVQLLVFANSLMLMKKVKFDPHEKTSYVHCTTDPMY